MHIPHARAHTGCPVSWARQRHQHAAGRGRRACNCSAGAHHMAAAPTPHPSVGAAARWAAVMWRPQGNAWPVRPPLALQPEHSVHCCTKSLQADARSLAHRGGPVLRPPGLLAGGWPSQPGSGLRPWGRPSAQQAFSGLIRLLRSPAPLRGTAKRGRAGAEHGENF